MYKCSIATMHRWLLHLPTLGLLRLLFHLSQPHLHHLFHPRLLHLSHLVSSISLTLVFSWWRGWGSTLLTECPPFFSNRLFSKPFFQAFLKATTLPTDLLYLEMFLMYVTQITYTVFPANHSKSASLCSLHDMMLRTNMSYQTEQFRGTLVRLYM